MIRTAIFVEGQTELIFVRELILKIFEYQNVALDCYTLFQEGKHLPTEYAFPNAQALYYFEINNVGNDKKVLSIILKREKYLWSASQNFDKVIGLRDMYSRDYREMVENHQISEQINQQFKENYQKQIEETAQQPDKISFHFAIMEVEAWFLAMKDIFLNLDSRLTVEYIKQHTTIDLNVLNPETAFFHPTQVLKQIYALAGGKEYDKSKGDISALASFIGKQDIENLLASSDSFKSFYYALPLP